MRITGGRARGRKIFAPKSDRIRITSDRVRESLFDILHPLEGTRLLDIYAGTGSVGIEALSRGGVRAVFIEKEPSHAGVIEKNFTVCGFADVCEVLVTSAQTGMRHLWERKEQFDIVFADPPYERGFVNELLTMTEISDLLAEDGTLVIEHSFREEISVTNNVTLVDQRRYGDTVLSFLKLRM